MHYVWHLDLGISLVYHFGGDSLLLTLYVALTFVSSRFQRYHPVDIREFSVLYDQLKMRTRLDLTNSP